MSLITNTACNSDVAIAARNLALRLDIDPITETQDQAEWQTASVAQRCIWIGEWLRTAAMEEAHRMDPANLVPFTPIGGEKYRHQND